MIRTNCASRASSLPMCRLCAQIAGGPEGDLLHEVLGGPYVRRVGPEDVNVVAIPSVGPLADGHVLICPRRHARSLACAPSTVAEAAGTLADALADALVRDFGAPVHRFEHGSAVHGERVACSVEHAHLHLVPARVDLWRRLGSILNWREVHRGPEALRVACGDAEYLRYEHPDGRVFVHRPGPDGVESQLVRRELAGLLGDAARWNWREHPEPARLERSWTWLAHQALLTSANAAA